MGQANIIQPPHWRWGKGTVGRQGSPWAFHSVLQHCNCHSSVVSGTVAQNPSPETSSQNKPDFGGEGVVTDSYLACRPSPSIITTIPRQPQKRQATEGQRRKRPTDKRENDPRTTEKATKGQRRKRLADKKRKRQKDNGESDKRTSAETPLHVSAAQVGHPASALHS